MVFSNKYFESNREFYHQVFVDWGPALVLSLIYTTLRRFVNQFRTVNVVGVYELEKFFFGWMTPKSDIPAFAFVDVNNPILTIFSVLVYSLHFFVPLYIVIRIGYWKPDRETFSKFRIVLITVTVLGFSTFILYPVAPPWYVLYYGFKQPHHFQGTSETAAGLLKFDELLNFEFFTNLYGTTPPAPFAAFPSLHSGWSFVCAYVLIKAYAKENKKIYLMLLYPASVWFATIYLQHHYIVDLIGGVIYAIVSYYLGVYIIRPLYHKYFGDNRLSEHNKSDKRAEDG